MRHPSGFRTIGILALPGVQLLDVAGPLDVFAEANVQGGRRNYDTSVIATTEGPICQFVGNAHHPGFHPGPWYDPGL